MALPDINDIKTIIRSILNSSQNDMTVSQLLHDYNNLEGSTLPYKQLGFNTIFEFLGTINDVLKMPPDPSMYSVIKLILHEKTSHLRELVVKQKNKRGHNKKKFRSEKSSYNCMLKSSNVNSHDYNLNNHKTHSTPKLDYRARGYDHVKTNSSKSKCPGIVTAKLKRDIENLCNNSEFVSVRTLKCNLINHADYKKLGTSNIEDSINMLKYFIYINRGGVHLKDSPYEIFQSNKSDSRKYTEPTTSTSCIKIVDEIEENELSDFDDQYFSDMDVFDSEVNISRNENKIIQKSISTEHNTNPHSISPLYTDSCQKLCTDYSLSQLDGMNQLPIREMVNMINTDLNDLESKNSDTVTPKNNDENILISSTVLSTTHLLNKIESKNECLANCDVKLIPSSSKNQKDNYKSAIVDIITKYEQPITVSQVLDIFKKQHGYMFPIEQFSCITYMDFFRLNSNTFRLENQCSTNSIVSLEDEIVLKPQTTIRKYFCSASIFQNNAVDNLEDSTFSQIEIISELLSNKTDDQQPEEPVINNLHNSHCEESTDSYEIYDSDMVLDTMKVKMRRILSKHKDGILCNDFMNVYGNEYNSHFTFSEYGFNSMRDMAFKLPSVFYVQVPEDNNEIILFEASRRSELEKKLNDPSLYYKNIPKTVLYNLSQLFDTHQTGIKFNEVMTLYCTEFGRAYEPLKYGFSCEENMFKSLNKMVEIKNNVLYTIDPFAYMHFIKNVDPNMCYEKPAPVLPGNSFLLNFSSSDICNGKFRYSKIEFNINEVIKINSAEIYNPSSFYIQLAAEANNLNSFMDALQVFYNDNDEKYSIRPDLIIPELACTSCFEDTDQWNRAIVTKIVDEENVQLFYVDYGSIEIVPKTKIRFLASKFGCYPSQAIHCGLYNYNELNYPHEINQYFVDLIEYNQQQPQFYQLEAQFHPPYECDNQKMRVTLFLNTKNNKININQKCSKELNCHLKAHQESVRKMIYKIMMGESLNKV